MTVRKPLAVVAVGGNALIRDDLNIRKIASDEIEKRHYLPLRPTDEEAFEARMRQLRLQQLEIDEAHQRGMKLERRLRLQQLNDDVRGQRSIGIWSAASRLADRVISL